MKRRGVPANTNVIRRGKRGVPVGSTVIRRKK